ncbi:hypothetical protein Salat_2891100 [Sesamum alatum]|uniref:Uncharacterized protein n=1 Tax=Sesamum alatum TaxID=300844 RepID=A0AAE1XI84_9LAMI|nr:hypothetical protein Salat_2891100 [Sesamum alatum]
MATTVGSRSVGRRCGATCGGGGRWLHLGWRSVRLAERSGDLDERMRKDCLVITWILNNISKKIVNTFMYVTSARGLWLELEARDGKSNGPMIYKLERQISSVSQGDLFSLAG